MQQQQQKTLFDMEPCQCPVEAFGEYLRGLGVPYIEVSEATRAIFAADPPLERFDYLVYSETGPNLLVIVTGPDGPASADLSRLAEWERLFGPDFGGAIVFRRDGEWVVTMLADWQDFPNPAHARAFELAI